MKKRLVFSMKEICDALTLRFQSPEWVLLHEVRNKTGYGTSERYADALAFNMYPSRGMELHGIEIKHSRSDWKKELATPDKAAAIQRFCNRWWIVVGDESIVWDGELPPTWGLLVPHRIGVLKCKTQAPELDAKELDRGFVMSVFRSFASAYTRKDSIASQLSDEYDRGAEAATYQQHLDRENVAKLTERINAFEEHSGVEIDSWRPGQVGDAVRALICLSDGAGDGAFSALKRHLQEVQKALFQIDTLRTDE